MARYEVIVGNIGKVYNGDSAFDAYVMYNTYRGLSKRGQGRCANEPVTLFRDDEITAEYNPETGV